MNRARLLVLLSCALLGAPAARAANPPAAAGVRSFTLANGMRVLLAPDARAGAVNVSVWYATGVRYERPGSLGLSHLCEHLSSRGATPGGTAELRRRIEAEGGSSVSYTSADYTCFTHTIPPAALAMVLQLEAGRFSLRPTEAMLDAERAVASEVLRAGATANPLERGLQRLYAAAFPAHPYRWPVLGSDGDLRDITLKQCEEFLRARYAPDQTLIAIVGDFDADRVAADVRRVFEPVRRKGRSVKAGAAPEPSRERRSVETAPVQVPMLMVGWQMPAAAAADGPALDLLSTVLSRGGSARLGRRRSPGDTLGLFAQTGRDVRREATMFWAATAAGSTADSAAVERWLIGEIERMAAEPVSGDDLDRARRQLELALRMARQTTRDRGQALGVSAMVAGDWAEADRHLERLQTLTPADLQQAAARTLLPSRRTVVWMMPAAGGRP